MGQKTSRNMPVTESKTSFQVALVTPQIPHKHDHDNDEYVTKEEGQSNLHMIMESARKETMVQDQVDVAEQANKMKQYVCSIFNDTSRLKHFIQANRKDNKLKFIVDKDWQWSQMFRHRIYHLVAWELTLHYSKQFYVEESNGWAIAICTKIQESVM